MKKTIEEISTIDELLESHIDTKEGLAWYKDRIIFIQIETGKKEISYDIKLLMAQTANIRFHENPKFTK